MTRSWLVSYVCADICLTWLHSWLIRDSFVTHSWLVRDELGDKLGSCHGSLTNSEDDWQTCQKRPTNTKRDLHIRKRPTQTKRDPHEGKKTNKYEKRPTHTKRDQHKWSETYTHEKRLPCAKMICKRDLHIRKETRENVQPPALFICGLRKET